MNRGRGNDELNSSEQRVLLFIAIAENNLPCEKMPRRCKNPARADILMVNIYAPNYRVLRCARVEVNWSLVLEYHEREPRSFSRKLRVQKRGEKEREKDR